MIPDTLHDIVCPTCKQKLAFKIAENILVPFKFEIPVTLSDGHKLSLNTTHYNETPQGVSQLVLIVITHCPGDDK